MEIKLYLTQKKEINYKQDLILRAKCDNSIHCVIYDENDLVVDITGAVVSFIVKEEPSDIDSSALITKEVTDFTDAQNGEIEIALDSTDTDITEGNYLYEIKIEIDGEEFILAEGNICFQRKLSDL